MVFGPLNCMWVSSGTDGFLTERRNQRFFLIHGLLIFTMWRYLRWHFCSLLSCKHRITVMALIYKNLSTAVFIPSPHWYSGLRWVWVCAPLQILFRILQWSKHPIQGRPFQMRQASDCKRWPGRHSHRCFLMIVEISFMVFETFFKHFLEDCWMNFGFFFFLSSDVFFFPPILDVSFFFASRNHWFF